MDNSLVQAKAKAKVDAPEVLILVVMDNSLVQYLKKISDREEQKRLNPCCNGQ